MKTGSTALFISVLLVSLAAGIHIVKANSNDYISFSGGLTIFSPINKTYNSNFLTLNITLGCGAGLQCSLNYSLDGKYEGPIPLMFNDSTGFQLIYLATGLVQLPELSKGSHRLTVSEEAELNDYHGANPPGAPFKPTAPGSTDYVASWVDTVDFYINSIAPRENLSENLWMSKAPMHVARADLGVAEINGKIYAIGGATQTIPLNTPLGAPTGEAIVGTNEQYDPATDTWTFKAPMPTPRFSFAIAAFQGKIYCIGGTGIGGASSNLNEVYNTARDTWETKAPIPKTYFPMQANVINGKIFVVGGNPFGGFTYFNEVYDPATDRWTSSTPMPYAEFDYTSTEADGKIYVLGGIDLLSGAGYPNQIYNPKIGNWSMGSTPPLTVFGPAAASTTGVLAPKRVYLIGGGQSFVDTNQPVFPTQVYDPKLNTWTYGTTMPTGRTNLGIANINDTLYAIGGYTYNLSSWHYGGTVLGGPMTPSAANEQYLPIGYGTPDQSYVLEHIPPKISLLSPVNQTYNNSSAPLLFTVDKAVNWTGYSLDEKQNVTITSNDALANMTNGLHSITVYANDTVGNMGASETITFTVAVPEPFPTAVVAVAAGILVAVVVLGIFYYLKIRTQRRTEGQIA